MELNWYPAIILQGPVALLVLLLLFLGIYARVKNLKNEEIGSSDTLGQLIVIVILFALYTIPILPSLVSVPFSLILWVGMPMQTTWDQFLAIDLGMFVEVVLFFIATLLAGTYLFTYVISLGITLKAKKIVLPSFLPVVHIVLFFVFYALAGGA